MAIRASTRLGEAPDPLLILTATAYEQRNLCDGLRDVTAKRIRMMDAGGHSPCLRYSPIHPFVHPMRFTHVSYLSRLFPVSQ